MVVVVVNLSLLERPLHVVKEAGQVLLTILHHHKDAVWWCVVGSCWCCVVVGSCWWCGGW